MKRNRPSRPRDTRPRDTRRRLLDAAGQVFAEKGFDGATGREICERAGVNAAAVNYHFDGIEALYEAVLNEAPRRLFSVEALEAAVAGRTSPAARLEAFLGLFVEALTGPASSTWIMQVLARELVAPSPALVALRKKEIYPKARILRAIVAEVTGLPESHPAVSRGCISVIAPCFLLLVFDRQSLMRMFPGLALKSADAAALTRHMVTFTLAGLTAIADEARENDVAT